MLYKYYKISPMYFKFARIFKYIIIKFNLSNKNNDTEKIQDIKIIIILKFFSPLFI